MEEYARGKKALSERRGSDFVHPLRQIPRGKSSFEYIMALNTEGVADYANDREKLEGALISGLAASRLISEGEHVYDKQKLDDEKEKLRNNHSLRNQIDAMDNADLLTAAKFPKELHHSMLMQDAPVLGAAESVPRIVRQNVRKAAREKDPKKAMAPYIALSIANQRRDPKQNEGLSEEDVEKELLASAALIQNSAPFQHMMETHSGQDFLDITARTGGLADLALEYEKTEKEAVQKPDDFRKFQQEKPYGLSEGVEPFASLHSAGAENASRTLLQGEPATLFELFKQKGMTASLGMLLNSMMRFAIDAVKDPAMSAFYGKMEKSEVLASVLAADSLVKRHGAETPVDQEMWEEELQSVRESNEFQNAVKGKSSVKIEKFTKKIAGDYLAGQQAPENVPGQEPDALLNLIGEKGSLDYMGNVYEAISSFAEDREYDPKKKAAFALIDKRDVIAARLAAMHLSERLGYNAPFDREQWNAEFSRVRESDALRKATENSSPEELDNILKKPRQLNEEFWKEMQSKHPVKPGKRQDASAQVQVGERQLPNPDVTTYGGQKKYDPKAFEIEMQEVVKNPVFQNSLKEKSPEMLEAVFREPQELIENMRKAELEGVRKRK